LKTQKRRAARLVGARRGQQCLFDPSARFPGFERRFRVCSSGGFAAAILI
jgi:hypothetical protein